MKFLQVIDEVTDCEYFLNVEAITSWEYSPIAGTCSVHFDRRLYEFRGASAHALNNALKQMAFPQGIEQIAKSEVPA